MARTRLKRASGSSLLPSMMSSVDEQKDSHETSTIKSQFFTGPNMSMETRPVDVTFMNFLTFYYKMQQCPSHSLDDSRCSHQETCQAGAGFQFQSFSLVPGTNITHFRFLHGAFVPLTFALSIYAYLSNMKAP